MRYLLLSLFILAATYSSNARNISEIRAVKAGSKTILLPPTADTTIDRVSIDGGSTMSSWKEEHLVAEFTSYGPDNVLYTNDIGQVIPLEQTITERVYNITEHTEGDQGPYGDLEITEGLHGVLADGKLKFDSLRPSLTVGQNTNFYTGNYYSSRGVIDKLGGQAKWYDVAKEWPANDLGAFTNINASYSDRFNHPITVGFSGGWTNEYIMTRTPRFEVNGEYTQLTNSLRARLGGRNDTNPYRYLGFTPELSVAGYEWHGVDLTLDSALNDVVTKVNGFGGLTPWYTNFVSAAMTNMMTFGPESIFTNSQSNGNNYDLLVIDVDADPTAKITIHIPANFMSDPEGQYLLNMDHVSTLDVGYWQSLAGADLCYRYKINGVYKYHENLMGSDHYITIGANTNAFDITLEQYDSPYYVEGNPRRRAWDSFTLLKIPDELEVYSTLNLETESFVRNETCWAKGLDMTPFSPWNSHPDAATGLLTRRPVTAIGRDVVLMANHYHPDIGDEVIFVGENNEIVRRTLANASRVVVDGLNSYADDTDDLYVGVLDEPLPSTISHCKVLPQDYRTYLPAGIKTLPLIVIGKYETATLVFGAEFSVLFGGFVFNLPHAGAINSSMVYDTVMDSPYALGELRLFPKKNGYMAKMNQDYSSPLWDGDSGSPVFFSIAGQPILVTVLSTVNGGESVSDMIPAINQVIGDLGSTNLLDQIDLSVY